MRADFHCVATVYAWNFLLIDLYYMDLDGLWQDGDGDRMFDTHRGPVAPEIWIGRLTASPLTRAAVGVYTISATFKNKSTDVLTDPFFQVAELAYRRSPTEPAELVLLNADGGPGRVGAKLTIPGVIDPGHQFTVIFEIGLPRRKQLDFFVILAT